MKNTIIRVCDCIGYFVVLNLCWILCSIFGFRIPAIFNIDSLYHHSSHNTYPVVFLYIVYRLRFMGIGWYLMRWLGRTSGLFCQPVSSVTFLAYSGILMNAHLRKHRWSHSGKDLDQRLAELIEFCGMPRSKREIMDFPGLTDSKNFRKRYLVPLLNAGKIEMTIPDKPNSRKQKYKKVNSSA